MIGETILHYPPKADQPLADKIIVKLGEAWPVRRSYYSYSKSKCVLKIKNYFLYRYKSEAGLRPGKTGTMPWQGGMG